MKSKNRFLDELRSLKEQLKFDGKFNLPNGIENIVISGMGGSGIVGSIFREMYSERPVILVNGYSVPSFANKKTLFIAISYSGNTEETLSAYNEAKEMGTHTVVITSGGKLADHAGEKVLVPKGLQPRSALGYMLMPLLNSFKLSDKADVEEAYGILADIDRDSSKEERIAGQIFSDQSIPVVYGTSPYESIAYRWSTQFNENAKLMCIWNNFPELNHNNTMALRDTYRKDEFYYLCIMASEHEQIRKRISETQEVTGIRFREVIGPVGKSRLARLMYLVHVGDYITYHLAQLRKVDPLDVSAIEELKVRLAHNA